MLGRWLKRFAIAAALGTLALAWAGSYALALEFTFQPTAARRCEVGLNFGTLFVATEPWPAGRPMQTGLIGYDARPRGTALGGLGIYATLDGCTPGGRCGNAILGLPLWPPLAIVPAWLAIGASRARRRARAGRCRACGYDLRATPGRCPECGTRR